MRPSETILEPAHLDSGVVNEAFSDTKYNADEDHDEVFKESRPERRLWRWKLEGIGIVVLSVIVLSFALTAALILSIIFGEPQIKPHGSVASESAFCTNVGLEILKANDGNAVDAAVATAICLSVVRPDVSSLAGCGAMLVRDRNNESSRLFEFLCPAPSKFSLPDQNRPESLVAVPGVVKGLHEAHKLFGKLQWSALFEGALKAAKDGFKPDTALLNSVNVVKQANRSVPQPLVDGLLTWERLGRYQPPVELEKTLQSLSSTGSEYFYSQANNSFGSRLLSFLSSSGQGWGEAADIQNYTVNQPTPIKVGFAGFTLESFPAPLVGGAYLLQLLGNLDLKDTLAPLNYGALWENNPRETGTLLHRFIELSKLSAVAVGSLGDTSDPKIRDSAISAQNSLFDPDARKRTVNLVSDSATLPINASVPSFLNLSLGDTSIVVTDSSRFTVVISLYLGSLFGNGQIVPGTGVHLNSGLSPFLGPLPPGSTTGTLNLISSGRRPLVPIAPLYLSTTGRKCGIRTGIASSGGLWGVQDAAQTVINAALFLHAATCTLPSGSKPPLALVETDGARSRGASADKGNELNRSSYNPASTRGCINLQAATGFPRLHSDLKNISYAIYTEQTYNQTLLSRLQELGHIIHFWPSDWPGRVSAAGWNGYELMTSYDKRGSWSSAVY